MSWGTVICAKCCREVHQDGERPADIRMPRGWTHCVDKTPLCDGAKVVFPGDVSDIVGPWCGRDGKVHEWAAHAWRGSLGPLAEEIHRLRGENAELQVRAKELEDDVADWKQRAKELEAELAEEQAQCKALAEERDNYRAALVELDFERYDGTLWR